MLGTLVNSIAILLGSLLGMFIKGGISEKVSSTIIKALGLCVLYIGISGAFEGSNMTITIVSMALGSFIGESIDIDKKLDNLGEFIEIKFKSSRSKKVSIESCIEIDTEKKTSISEGFISSSLIFCVGAMAIVGALESGIQGNHSTLFAKSILDGILAIVFTASLGIGVIFSSLSVLLYQGIITIGAKIVAGLLSQTIISSITGIGSLLIIGLGLNMLECTKIKVGNLLPAVFIPIILGIIGVL